MPTTAAVRMSTLRGCHEAAAEAATAAAQALGAPADLAIVFATVGYEQPALLKGVRAALGSGCAVVGCSGEGVIAQGHSNESDRAIGVMAIALDGATVEVRLVESYGRDPTGAAAELAAQVGDTSDVIGIVVLPDGLKGNCSDFLAALRRKLPGVQIAGGAAGDAMTFDRTYQYCNDQVGEGAVSAAVFRGKGTFRVEVSHGCTPVGPHQTITRLDGAWLQEIDHQPAWDVFRGFLDGDPADLNAEGIVHLCIGTSADRRARFITDPMIIRTPLALEKKTGALFFPGGGLFEGQRIRMTRRDGDRIRGAAETCARSLVHQQPKPPAFVLQFDCAGRGKVMFGACAADQIIKPLRAEIGDAVPWAGFHTYGEIAGSGDALAYHNYTVALCAFYDA